MVGERLAEWLVSLLRERKMYLTDLVVRERVPADIIKRLRSGDALVSLEHFERVLRGVSLTPNEEKELHRLLLLWLQETYPRTLGVLQIQVSAVDTAHRALAIAGVPKAAADRAVATLMEETTDVRDLLRAPAHPKDTGTS